MSRLQVGIAVGVAAFLLVLGGWAAFRIETCRRADLESARAVADSRRQAEEAEEKARRAVEAAEASARVRVDEIVADERRKVADAQARAEAAEARAAAESRRAREAESRLAREVHGATGGDLAKRVGEIVGAKGVECDARSCRFDGPGVDAVVATVTGLRADLADARAVGAACRDREEAECDARVAKSESGLRQDLVREGLAAARIQADLDIERARRQASDVAVADMARRESEAKSDADWLRTERVLWGVGGLVIGAGITVGVDYAIRSAH